MKVDILMMGTCANKGFIFKVLQKVGAWLRKKYRLLNWVNDASVLEYVFFQRARLTRKITNSIFKGKF